MALMLGRPVRRASSVGSVMLFSRKSIRSKETKRSIPASEDNRFPRRFNAVMAGRGHLVRECRESIIFPERFNARRLVSMARDSGIDANKLLDRSRDVRDPDTGTNAAAEIV